MMADLPNMAPLALAIYDTDGDGRISYREIAAFVARANAAIPGERFRPDVFARPPRSGAPLVG